MASQRNPDSSADSTTCEIPTLEQLKGANDVMRTFNSHDWDMNSKLTYGSNGGLLVSLQCKKCGTHVMGIMTLKDK